MFVGSLFDIPAILLKADFWRLSSDENEMLCNALMAYVDSLPKAKGNKISKWIGENMPVLNLAMVALFIVGDRMKQTVALMKQQKQAAITRPTPQAGAPNADRAPTTNERGGLVTPLDYVHGNVG